MAATLAVATLMPAVALSDGDPASDVLIGENVFYPFSPPVSGELQKELGAETAAASHAHLPIKVALIASPVDLGTIPELFDKPQQYADFLDQEISFQMKVPLLVVMPAGYGVAGFGQAATAAAASLTKPSGGVSDDLARAAITAVGKLAAAAGHPITGTGGTSGGSTGNSTTAVSLAILVLAAIGAATAIVIARRRHARAR